MSVAFDARWNEAMGRYQAAIALCERVAEETTLAMSKGVTPTVTSFSKEECARALVDARKAMLLLLREKSPLPGY